MDLSAEWGEAICIAGRGKRVSYWVLGTSLLVFNYLHWLGRHIAIICNPTHLKTVVNNYRCVSSNMHWIRFNFGPYDLRYTDLDNILSMRSQALFNLALKSDQAEVCSACTAGWLRLVGDHLWVGHKASPPWPYPNFPVCWAGEALRAVSVCSGQGTSFWKTLLQWGKLILMRNTCFSVQGKGSRCDERVMQILQCSSMQLTFWMHSWHLWSLRRK